MMINSLYRFYELVLEVRKEHRLVFLLLGLWGLVTRFFSSPEFSLGINSSVPVLVLIGLLTFLVTVHLCWWLLERFWRRSGLPDLAVMVLGFRTMEVWQQLGFYFLGFALLLVSAVMCLGAVV